MTATENTKSSVRNQVSEEEWGLRVNLAACYNLAAMYGWDDLIFTHISARVPGPEKHFLINPYGLLFDEITASNLVKIDLDSNIVMDSEYEVNPAGFNIHSAVHNAREDAHIVMHLHTNEGVAVSIQDEGLLPLSQQSLFPISSLSYHAYEGISLDPDERKRIVQDLGNANFMILRNHGLLTCADNVPDAFLYMYTLQRACEIQLQAQATGNSLSKIPTPIVNGIQQAADKVLKSSGGALAWPGLLRRLDKHGYPYKN